MTNTRLLPCDGCGQPASTEHIAKRLRRLEWTTRFRPVHIQTLLLGAVAPSNDAEFFYASESPFTEQARHILDAAGVSPDEKSAEAILAEFQRTGFLLTYALECPIEGSGADPAALQSLILGRLPTLVARVRRSLRPKRLVPISCVLEPVVGNLEASGVGCPIVLDGSQPFNLDSSDAALAARRLCQALAGASAAGR